ncbi:hypothetical protein RHGRI_031244 [Rhododendron griersonianum]|uniref:Pentatricopeptide repeat-containing protein n=1 Tax=Rhododendron griersonianum TaxID=479676 RepID=A0AAV6I794_9ERIC|nr:hypothetical protein RHGRI_031244 [Rhododendron griersonianum]
MGTWAVEPKITQAVRTPITTFLKRSSLPFHRIHPNRSPRFYNSSHKNQHVLLPIKPFVSVHRAGHLSFHSSAHLSFAFLPFDKMSQREQSSENRGFFDALDLVKFAAMRPDIVTATIVHPLVLKVGVLAHLPTSTSLLMIYARAGDFDGSVALFREIIYKDVVLWNAMITACIENRFFGAAIDFFVEMMKGGSGFDSGTLVIAISGLTHTKGLKQGRVLHGLSVKAGMLSDSVLCNALVYMYAQCSDLSSSESIFEEIHCRDLVSWNSVMTGCLHNNNPEKCLHYLKRMNACGKQADDVSLSCAIAASTSLDELVIGQVIHGWGIKFGYEKSFHISVANSLISLYSQCGQIEAAEAVFRGIFQKDVISWNSMIDGFASNGMILEAFDLLREMQLKGSVQPDTVTVVAIIPLCAEFTLLREGRCVHGFTVRRSMGLLDLSVVNSLMDLYMKCNNLKAAEQLFNAMAYKDLVSWNTMISGYSLNGHSREAQILFKELLLLSSYCSLSTLLAILPSCHSHSSLQFGKSIHCWQLKLTFSSNNLAINSLIHMYVNCGDLKSSVLLFSAISATADISCWNTIIAGCLRKGHFWKALENFNLMRRESHVIAAWNSMISAFGFHSNGQKAIQVFHEMIESGTRPSKSTFISLLSTCSHLGLVDEGQWYYNHMLDEFGVEPETEHHVCIVDMLGRSGRLNEAYEFIERMGTKPEPGVWGALLSACNYHGDLEMGREVAETLFSLEPENAGYYVSMFNMYVSAGRWSDAAELRRVIQEKGLKKPVGYSLIDVGIG